MDFSENKTLVWSILSISGLLLLSGCILIVKKCRNRRLYNNTIQQLSQLEIIKQVSQTEPTIQLQIANENVQIIKNPELYTLCTKTPPNTPHISPINSNTTIDLYCEKPEDGIRVKYLNELIYEYIMKCKTIK